MSITRELFGNLPDGTAIDLYILSNAVGARVRVMTYGGILVGVDVPDRDGTLGDVSLGFDSLDGYVSGNDSYFGALVGRYANRIGGGRFELDGEVCELAVNNGPNHLHGGLRGFDKVVWQADLPDGESGNSLRLRYVSADGEEGYPGELTVTVTYAWTDECELVISYAAATTKPTVVNLTNHAYFNLTAGRSETVLDHVVSIAAGRYTPVDGNQVPTGELATVEGTPYDFRVAKPIGRDLAQSVDADGRAGFDHNLVLDHEVPGGVDARAVDPLSGRTLEATTTEPGLQFYTGNFLEGVAGRGGAVYNPQAGFCLEAQKYPDSPNKPRFPSPVLRPGETYTQVTRYRFGTDV